jgi:hypothetical protein
MHSVSVLYQSERHIDAWEQRHALGEVPGRWPYGLDALSAPGVAVEARQVFPPTRAQSALNRLAGNRSPAGRGVRSPGSLRDIGLTWDENMARRMAIVEPHAEMYSGVIWLTDLLASSPARALGSMRGILRRMTRTFVLSRAQVEPLTEFLGADGPPVDYVRFGVDTDFYSYAPYPTTPMLLSVGGDRDRDAALLFGALEHVRRTMPHVSILVQTKSSLTPPAGVTVVSQLSHLQLRSAYENASVVLLATKPNLHVSGMTVSLEAMATGRPVVITETPGMSDYISHETTGLMVGRHTAEELGAAALSLLADHALAEAMGVSARRWVEDNFTVGHLARRLADVMSI